MSYLPSMLFRRCRPALRRLALALAAAQLVAYAAVPILEARAERASGPAFERKHSSSCVVLHSSATCLACQLCSTHGVRPTVHTVSAASLGEFAPARRVHA